MTRDELMQLAADKAAHEMQWESIEFLFKPQTFLELLLRRDFDRTKAMIADWFLDDSPRAIPHRYRHEPMIETQRAIRAEEFYRAIRKAAQ